MTYQAALPCPRETKAFVAELLRQQRGALGTRAGRRALAWPRRCWCCAGTWTYLDDQRRVAAALLGAGREIVGYRDS
ncbi:hypothetical protein M2302_006640 [Micromonospora sp. A200]|uniref:hypothetical protein n=1 Tax=Micromonospora sp. A200 TaxID=2940568 RepID=UPI0024740CA7|nr:hypothetical protein [Micromonospora sp. A200]MDH6466432.1 hypothetical protein [Micromonospora sp. A200]